MDQGRTRMSPAGSSGCGNLENAGLRCNKKKSCVFRPAWRWDVRLSCFCRACANLRSSCRPGRCCRLWHCDCLRVCIVATANERPRWRGGLACPGGSTAWREGGKWIREPGIPSTFPKPRQRNSSAKDLVSPVVSLSMVLLSRVLECGVTAGTHAPLATYAQLGRDCECLSVLSCSI